MSLGVRITVIAQNGTVIGDSDEPAGQLENHGSRPEVIEALSRGAGSAVRYSTSVKQDLLYRAYRQNDGPRQRVLRVAVSFSEVQNVTRSLGRTLLFGLLLCSLLRTSGGLPFLSPFEQPSQPTGRVFEGGRRRSIRSTSFLRSRDDELNVLEQNLRDMSLKIRDNINALRSEKEKVDSILEMHG